MSIDISVLEKVVLVIYMQVEGENCTKDGYVAEFSTT